MFAAIQLSSQGDVGENLARVEALVETAVKRGASVVVLPENFAYFGDEEGKRAMAEDVGFLAGHDADDSRSRSAGPIATCVSSLAQRYAVHIVAGGMPERSFDPDRPYNSCVVFDSSGRVAHVYRKIHLFDVDLADGAKYRESASTMPGTDPLVAQIAGFNVGLSVCYDVRFPELYRALSSAGAEVIVVPAAFTLATGKDHWMVLLRARAIEAQCYVVAAAQWGKHPRGRQTFGKSCVIDPWGDVIAQASEGEGVVVAPIDRDYLAKVRASLPSLAHRRL